MTTALDNLLQGIVSAPLPLTRPWITVTYAQSLDGSLAGPQGARLRLSGDASLTLTHRLRGVHDSILIGIGTLLADDPRLTLRLASGEQPQPIVLDSHLRTPPQAAILRHPRPVWLAAGPEASATDAEALRQAGAVIVTLPVGPLGGIDLSALFAELRHRGVRRVMVEGGASVITAVVAARLVDLFVLTIAPVIIGGLHPFHASDSSPLARISHPCWAQAGDDMIAWGTPEWPLT